MNRIKEYFSKQYQWYGSNIQKIIFVVSLHFILYYLANIPYINIFTSLFSSLPYFLDWIAILVLFRPKKELVLKVGLLLFLINYFFALIKINFIFEAMGEVSFLMIGTYVILSLHELRKKTV